jgi:hypothetical protein
MRKSIPRTTAYVRVSCKNGLALLWFVRLSLDCHLKDCEHPRVSVSNAIAGVLDIRRVWLIEHSRASLEAPKAFDYQTLLRFVFCVSFASFQGNVLHLDAQLLCKGSSHAQLRSLQAEELC